jgi:hypothetical protein
LNFVFVILISLANAQTVDPGVWQVTSNFNVSGLAMPESKSEECVSAEDAKDLKASLSRELGKSGCVATKWLHQGEKVDIGLKCNKSGLVAAGDLQGVVKAKSYQISGTAEGTFQNIPATADIRLKGQWLKSCP